MKNILTSITVLLLLAGHACADALKDTVRGGLLGAAAGALVSELDDNYDARYTIPFFTGIGALTGYAIHENRQHRDHHGAYRRHAYYLPYMALPYAWYHHRRPAYGYGNDYDYGYYREPLPRRDTRKPPPPQPKAVDRHPGVTLIPVPITLRNGTVVPIHVLKLGERYTGPQGESYETMPDAATLQRRYAP